MNTAELLKTLGLSIGTNEWWLRIGWYESGWIWGFWLFWAFLLGGCMGSFLNVCVLRIPRGESIAGAPSHCFGCGSPIRWYDNIPIWSYLLLGGRCRVCAMRIPPRYFIMEVLTGLLYAGTVAKTGWSSENPETLIPYIVLVSLALTVFQIDWKCRIIPDVATYPAMAAGLLVGGLLPGTFARETWLQGLLFSGTGLAAAGIFLALFTLIGRRIAGQEVFGWGDVKYVMAAGALTGLPGAVFILTLGSLLGVAFGLYVGFRRHRRGRPWRGVHVPLGVFLAVASGVWVFAGDWLLRWYFEMLVK